MVAQMELETDIAANLAGVKERIAEAATAAHRLPSDIALVAVGKANSAERVRSALEAGHRVFGENRVQEAEEKWPDLKVAFPEARLHLVGPLQSNKVHRAVALFDVIESVDRLKLARALAKQMETTGRRPDCLIQVNNRRGTAEGGRAARGCRRVHWRLPRRTRPTGAWSHVRSADG